MLGQTSLGNVWLPANSPEYSLIAKDINWAENVFLHRVLFFICPNSSTVSFLIQYGNPIDIPLQDLYLSTLK